MNNALKIDSPHIGVISKIQYALIAILVTSVIGFAIYAFTKLDTITGDGHWPVFLAVFGVLFALVTIVSFVRAYITHREYKKV